MVCCCWCRPPAPSSSCEDKDKIPAPEVQSVPLVFPQIDATKNYFQYTRTRQSVDQITAAGGTRPVFEFTLNLGEQRDINIKTIQVYKSFRRGTGAIGPRVLVGDYSTFPAIVSINSQDALTGLMRVGVDANDRAVLVPVKAATNSTANPISPNDAIIFTFEYIAEDGRHIILTPLTKTTLADGSTFQSISGTQINAPYAAIAVIKT